MGIEGLLILSIYKIAHVIMLFIITCAILLNSNKIIWGCREWYKKNVDNKNRCVLWFNSERLTIRKRTVLRIVFLSDPE